MKQTILIHYHEISLKGNNRGWFENQLHRHVAALLKDLPHGQMRRFAGRLGIELLEGATPEDVAAFTGRLRAVFGIANFIVARETPADLDAIKSELRELAAAADFQSFKVDARRGTKEFPLNSQQLNQQLGAYLQELTQKQVRMENPDAVFAVEIASGRAFLSVNKIQGAGGLPSGTGGKAVCLLSGGLDSPVAAWRIMRRGCRVQYVHFHSFPHTTVESQDKVRNILRVLSRYQLESVLYLVPFAEVQREIVAYAPPPLRVVLYRRFMVRIAEAVAQREKAAALVTGDSLGQVASQTMENIRTISAAGTLPIFRPLIGDDKEDIVRMARAIGTYDISIQADQDCCSLFVPKHPETMSDLEQAERAEEQLDIPRLCREALDGMTREIVLPEFT
ncbi:MAG: tRNA 4-thiouridine(8) synthase ThiI [Acidobacteriota bacterium]|nr:tRNA 4-thiouridine(8) synthase ThiI [Acidobacteriota bacterium]